MRKGAEANAIVLSMLLGVGCATQTVSPERAERVAVITSGSTNFFLATNLMPTISVWEVDGAPPGNIYGPIELLPGPHVVKLKCSHNISELRIDAVEGEVYEFAIVSGGALPSQCQGTLIRTKSSRKKS